MPLGASLSSFYAHDKYFLFLLNSFSCCLLYTALEKFFVEDEGKNRSDVIGPIIERLNYFLHQMEQQKLYRFFATSLLIIYEGVKKQSIRKPNDQLDIRLVDFAHAFERNPEDFSEPDYNTMFGVKNLIDYLEQLKVRGSGTSNVL